MESTSGKIEKEDLSNCLYVICEHYNLDYSKDVLLSGLPLMDGDLTPSIFSRAAERAGLNSKIATRTLEQINPSLLPAVLILQNNTACVLMSIDNEQQTVSVIYPDLPGADVEESLEVLSKRYTQQVIFARPKHKFDERTPKIKRNTTGHWFWGVIKECRGLYRDVIISAVVINLFSVAMPLFVMNIYDRVVPNGAVETLWMLASGVAIVLLADLVLKMVRNYYVELAASRIDVKVSSSLMEKILNIRLLDRPPSSGAFASGIQSFESIRALLSSLTLVSFVDLPFVLLFSVIIAIISPVLVLPIIVGSLLIVGYAFSAQKKLHSLANGAMQSGALRNAILVESIDNIEEIKSFHAESKVQVDWEKSTIFLARTQSQIRFISSSISNVSQFIQQLVGIVILIIGVYLIIEGELTQGALIAAYMLSSRAMNPINLLAGVIAQYHNAATSMEMLNTLMDQPLERPVNTHKIKHATFKGDIEFKNVTFRYDDDSKDVLSNVSFKINAGDHVAILGKNGSGKSTIQKLLLGLYTPTSGHIYIDGIELQQLELSELRNNVGYVPQEISLFFGSLRDNIMYLAKHAEPQALTRALELSGLMSVVNNHPDGLDMQVGEHGHHLSGGQKQAVAIARAIVANPPFLLLDEPTSSLDHQAEDQVKSALESVSAGRTMLMVTHRVSLLSMVNQIIVLDAGKVVIKGERNKVLEALKSGNVRATI
ncbi:type I secretion system permease/ATPase [Paraglaciecola chathamensis]|uniref:ATP-binding cassette, subfamily B, bacterial n=1 Tax=Paraglaciecola chathamensis S18K6 TaxID=1127672 RepID=A0AAV3V264_9ALTE|nr:type I secretion system permease/ATPase [Paraglaciecola chathamensis]GAC10985.1 ATP-binding cassette, subfamily B, bacterial [Paraglaciecola chathamensis S18K6]